MSWNNDSIVQLTSKQHDWTVEQEGDCISISNDDGLDAFVYAGTQQILAEVEKECGWMYETRHTDGHVGKINYTV